MAPKKQTTRKALKRKSPEKDLERVMQNVNTRPAGETPSLKPIMNTSDALRAAIFGPGFGNGQGSQLSQVDTLFYNMRWYLLSNMRTPLNWAYVEIGVVKTVVDVPVEDALRGGMTFHSKQLSAEELEKLHNEMAKENDLGKAGAATKWMRLFGGGAIIVVTKQPMEEPLDIEALQPGDKLGFRDVDMWELSWNYNTSDDEMGTDGGVVDPIDNPKEDFYRFYGHKIHKSRVLIMKGIRAPSFIRPRLRGWGLSVVEILIRSINQYLKSNDLIFEVLDEFKIDIFKIKNLTDTLMSEEGQQRVHNRIQTANMEKNYNHALTMDADDDYAQKELTFTGLADTQIGIRMQVASDLRMPLTKVFGISASGFSSGEDDIENYNAMVESSIRTPLNHHLVTMAKLRCQVLFGFIPDDLTGEFKPLRMLSSEQQENVKNAQFNRLWTTFSGGGMSQKEFKDAVNKDKLLPIQLDTTLDTVSAKLEQDSLAAEGEGAEVKPAASKSKQEAKEAKT